MPAAALALVALLAAAVSCVPSTQDLRTDITIIRDNDLLGESQPVSHIHKPLTDNGNLLDSKSPAANASALFLRARVPLREAKSMCKDLGEKLWEADSNSTQRILDILDYQEPDVDLSAIWVMPKNGDDPQTINLKGEVSSADTSDTNTVLCTQTAPYSNGIAQDSSPRWQTVVYSNREAVLGFRDRNSFRFHGMRYATRTKRFAYPKMYRGSGGNATALEFGSPCYQGFGGTEDCLYLNVYTPYLPRNRRIDSGLRPVMFWIHGGALTSGFGSDPLFDGGNLASRGDVVVVTINYRLGSLGFLAIDDGETNGNFGLADQILALDWVRQHIRDFGGDPSKITIFGQSAGAASVRAMMASPKAAGKFAGAIPLSNLGGLAYGTSYSKYFSIEEQLDLVGNAILGTTNCTNATSQLDCLRDAPLGSLGPGARYLVNDGVYLTTDELSLKGDSLNVNVMMGITSEDGLPFLILPRNGTVLNDTQWLTSQGLPAPPRRLFPPTDVRNQTRAAFGVGARLATDAMFRCVDQATAYAGLENGVLGSKVYYYEFERTYQTPEWPRLDICEAPKSKAHPNGNPESPINNLRCHSGELLPLFGNLVRQGNPLRDENDLPWMQYLVDTFTSFARTYDPNPDKAFLKARGFDSTLRALEKAGPWEPSVKGDMKMRAIDWPVKDNMMRGFKDVEQCEWLKLPLDFYV
ncbi:carboxylesterase [Colletotrichum paranaense]|uniref:Carboxylic ester hydrolase n=1 Tax=Colletotrichum paranaense TaxID=1914294 RepID=A0ABQ9SFB8_9PEZI|nr:carboxylesterase [Colletotrichum paranaense]KAK1535403.1 carboxylesterase [Colletotrichum paranaense]